MYKKGVSLIMLPAMWLAARTRHSSDDIAPAPSCSTAPNTITIVDDGNSYCIGGYGLRRSLSGPQDLRNNVAAICYASPRGATLDVQGDGSTFALGLFNDDGPPRGVGTYSFSPADSNMSFFKERFAGGQSYKVTSGTLTTTSADSFLVQFALQVRNASGAKLITGTVLTTQPR